MTYGYSNALSLGGRTKDGETIEHRAVRTKDVSRMIVPIGVLAYVNLPKGMLCYSRDSQRGQGGSELPLAGDFW